MEEEAPDIPANTFLGEDRLRFGETGLPTVGGGGDGGEPKGKKQKMSKGEKKEKKEAENVKG